MSNAALGAGGVLLLAGMGAVLLPDFAGLQAGARWQLSESMRGALAGSSDAALATDIEALSHCAIVFPWSRTQRTARGETSCRSVRAERFNRNDSARL